MTVLFGCEESGVCREQFELVGHDAWSCDLLPSRKPGQHIRGDVIEAMLSRRWDMIFLFPPCTHLAVSGNRWYAGTELRKKALEWTFNAFAVAKNQSDIGCGFENPIGVFSNWIAPSQIIQPWQFGHGETKATCLWLDRLPLLKPTAIVEGREGRVWKMAPGPNRQRDRSTTYIGIAKAMANQWLNREPSHAVKQETIWGSEND